METDHIFEPESCRARVLKTLLCGEDVPIDKIYEQHIGGEDRSARERQKYVGAVVSQMNQKLQKLGFKIVPGEARRTYRLTQPKD